VAAAFRMNSPDRHYARRPSRSVAAGRRRLTLACVLLAAVLVVAGFAAFGGSAAPPLLSKVAPSDATEAAYNVVTVSPLPGTPDASPTTQISFLGARGTTVDDVRVTGSKSGLHSGHLERYSTGTGESFLTSGAFTPGETVHVTARVTSLPHDPLVHTNFAIAVEAPVEQAPFPHKTGDLHAVQHYSSAPTLTPSTVTITTPAQPGATPGDFFLAPYQGAGSPGPMIVNQAGQLIWFHPLPAGYTATNFQVQQYEGKPVLTWWQGKVLKLGFGQGEDEIYNTSYKQVAVVHAGNGFSADLHVISLTPQGTAWIDDFCPVELNLSSIGGSAHAVVNESIVQEIDIKTGLVMWEWHALGHIPLRDSKQRIPHTSENWDYVHVNSIQPNPTNPNLLLFSARNTWTLYEVNMHSGAILWQLGGDHSNFKHGPGTFFFWQHDAGWQPGGLISVFDNGASPPEEKQSRGLVLDPNLATHTVTLVHAYTNPTKTLLASSQGDILNMGNGDWLMGYGGLPNFTEYNSTGAVLYDATLGVDVQDFRTYLSPWSATPTTAPSIAAQSHGTGAVSVQASWNGATSVASWRVLAGPSASHLAASASAPSTGFQTTISVKSAAYVEVEALNAAGKVLGHSAAIAPTS
jgi:hypothetical protein